MKRADRVLERFADWFASRNGVWFTVAGTGIVVGVELFFPNIDPHGFWVLYWLTVYSAITQPVLAYCARRAAEQADVIMNLVKAEEDVILLALEELGDEHGSA